MPEKNKIITILNKKINLMEMSEVMEKISYWIEKEHNKSHWIVLCGMHGIIEGYKDPKFEEMINSAEISLIDGMSLVFIGRLKGFKIGGRLPGPDLMSKYFEFAKNREHTNFFLGDTEDTLKKLNEKISHNFPNLKVSGSYSPPFKEFSEDDNNKIIEFVNQKNPDILWVAFNLKKQEEWIYRNRHRLKAPVIIGVGAAFKFLSGKIKRAPKWIGNLGLEWLWRLFHEPRRIWYRVFVYGPIFFWISILELIGIYRKK